MNSDSSNTVSHEAALFEDSSAWRGRRHVPGSANYVLFGIFGTIVAVTSPMLLALSGIGMSRQDGDVATSGAMASALAIISSFLIIRRLRRFPLLQTYGYVALTFASNFAIVAVVLKFFRVDFSSPQFFLAMVMITGMVELFFYANRRSAPMRIAIVPATPTTAVKLPELLTGSVRFTTLTSPPSGDFEYDGVIADLNSDLEPRWEHLLALAALRGIPVHHVKQFNELMTGRVAVDHLRENTLGAVVPSLIYPQFKRAIDLAAALLLLPVIGAIVTISAIMIKLETSGPIFYRQRRAGLGGRPFMILKLRTMRDDQGGADYTVEGDGRITRVGRLLRQYRIDELPQIFNILRGDMSWIGPRPEAMSLVRWYEREVPFYVYRHIVQPGITGWAQVHQGNVAAVDAAQEKLEYDFYYIKHFSFWLDAVIVIKTLRTIVTGFGSR